MVSKKFKLLLAIVALFQTALYAQDSSMSSSNNGTDANWAYDSSKVSSKNMPQYNEFTNYQNPYPAKPRSQWELSFGGGNAIVIGDRPMFSKDNGAKGGYVGGITGSISARFPLSHYSQVD
jgi:OOP family OmpA-OmpF porin